MEKVVWRGAVKTGDGFWDPSEAEQREYLAQVKECCSKEEYDKVMRYRFLKDTKSAIASRLLVRYFLLHVCSLSFESKRLPLRRVHGKPYLVREDGEREAVHVDFNVSHAGAWTILVGCYIPATAPASPVIMSCDVMPVLVPGRDKDQKKFFATLRTSLTAREWQRIEEVWLTERQQLVRFYEHWTLKECYIKAVGVGLAFPLDQVEIRKPVEDDFMEAGEREDTRQNIDETAELVVKGQPLVHWSFEQHWLDEEHVAAVAICPLQVADKEFRDVAYSAAAVAQAPETFNNDVQAAPFTILQPSDLL